MDEQSENNEDEINCTKICRIFSLRTKRAMREFPIIKQIINSNKEILKELKLDEEEIEYLKN